MAVGVPAATARRPTPGFLFAGYTIRLVVWLAIRLLFDDAATVSARASGGQAFSQSVLSRVAQRLETVRKQPYASLSSALPSRMPSDALAGFEPEQPRSFEFSQRISTGVRSGSMPNYHPPDLTGLADLFRCDGQIRTDILKHGPLSRVAFRSTAAVSPASRPLAFAGFCRVPALRAELSMVLSTHAVACGL